LIAIGIICYKITSNFVKLKRIKYIENEYTKWLNNDEKSNVLYLKAEYARLLRNAKCKEYTLPYVQPLGYNRIAKGNLNVIDNFPNKRQDIVLSTINLISEAYGVYRSRIFESINPLYWIDSVIFLPRTVLEYLGVKNENIAVKILNIIYWISAPIALIYKDKLVTFISDWLSHLIH
jgi:hypothetical protein